MDKIIKSEEIKAYKEYYCDASKAFSTWAKPEDYDLTENEFSALKRAENNGYKINKGEKYLKQIINSGGQIITYRAIPEIHKMAEKYQMFD